MPSSYTASARFVLQATGENNNTWGVILNQGAFQLIDDNINGHLGFPLSTTKTLSTVNGATDEARMAFLDVTGGTGGAIVIPPVPKGYLVRNAASGAVSVTAGGPTNVTLQPGDIAPVQTDGAAVYGLQIGGKGLQVYIDTADQTIINYVNAAISQGNAMFPPAVAGNVNQALMNRQQSPGVYAWVPSAIQQADVTGLTAALAALSTQISTVQATVEDEAVAWALTL